MTTTRPQNLRMLQGRYVLARAAAAQDVALDAGLLVLVIGPDGATQMRRDDTAADTWVALWNGDQAHDPNATGMLSAVVSPLADGEVPVWVAASYDGDLVLVPADRLEVAVNVLRAAGHQVAG